MIHKIKNHKINNISMNMTHDITGISKGAISKYWDMSEEEIVQEFERQKTYKKELDQYQEYLKSSLDGDFSEKIEGIKNGVNYR